MRPRKQETILWTRTKPVYGLTEASREWHCRMSKEIIKLRCLGSKYGYAVHNSWKSGGIQGQILPNVEDLLYGGSDCFHRKAISKKDTDLAHVDRHMKQDNHFTIDSQDNHSKKVDKPVMGGYNDKEGEKALKKDEQSHFRKLVENINWLATNIRPDLCLNALELA